MKIEVVVVVQQQRSEVLVKQAKSEAVVDHWVLVVQITEALVVHWALVLDQKFVEALEEVH